MARRVRNRQGKDQYFCLALNGYLLRDVATNQFATDPAEGMVLVRRFRPVWPRLSAVTAERRTCVYIRE